MVNLTLYTVKAVVMLDSEGGRVLAKYFGTDYASAKDQKAFEKGLYDKTKRAPHGEILLFDNQVVLYRFHEDVFFYIVGMPEENEAMLLVILNAFSDAVSMLLRYGYFEHGYCERSLATPPPFPLQTLQSRLTLRAVDVIILL